MLEEENLVTEVTENVEETTEQTTGIEQVAEPTITEPVEETFTKTQVDEMIAKKIARREAKIRKDYEKKYGKLENVLRAGTGKEDLEEITTTFADFYTNKGIDIPKEPTYSDRDVEILARAEADDIISNGFDEVVEEVDRLAEIGVANMTPREKATFQRLAEYRQNEEARKELAKIGVGDKVLQDTEFVEFSSKLNPSLSIKEKYELYSQIKPKPEVKPMGSMKNNTNNDSGVKDFYTRDEALKFTKKDFDKNPALYKAVEQSMSKW
jgi:hypothetical protein